MARAENAPRWLGLAVIHRIEALVHVKRLLVAAAAAMLPIVVVTPVAAAAPAAPTVSRGVLPPGATLAPDDQVRSNNGQYTLVMQQDGNLVLYAKPDKAIWDSRTQGSGLRAVMQQDGNLVVYTPDDKPLYDTATGGHPGAKLAVQDDGNLVIYGKGGDVLWGRQLTWGRARSGDVLEPARIIRSANQKCFLAMQEDGNLVLYRTRDKKALWDSRTGGNPGARAQMQGDGNLVVVSSGPAFRPLWDSATGGKPGAWLAVQDDCNLVVYSSNNKPLWDSGTGGKG
ncbi:hypothetical protein ACQEVB_37740 [Pseudonocardia sp. CA-107938]|uniref:hypothetical protein n=1 Tax=Pseudonocardia sp. CA-107938 TaxID=3240021 RepID=UPI003D8A70ED